MIPFARPIQLQAPKKAKASMQFFFQPMRASFCYDDTYMEYLKLAGRHMIKSGKSDELHPTMYDWIMKQP